MARWSQELRSPNDCDAAMDVDRFWCDYHLLLDQKLSSASGVPVRRMVPLAPRGQVVIESWCQHYNEVRPHSNLQYLTSVEFKQQLYQDLQPEEQMGRRVPLMPHSQG